MDIEVNGKELRKPEMLSGFLKCPKKGFVNVLACSQAACILELYS